MVDLADICGDVPMRASFMRKRERVQEKLNKIAYTYDLKTKPLLAEIKMYDEMIAAIERRVGADINALDETEESAA